MSLTRKVFVALSLAGITLLFLMIGWLMHGPDKPPQPSENRKAASRTQLDSAFGALTTAILQSSLLNPAHRLDWPVSIPGVDNGIREEKKAVGLKSLGERLAPLGIKVINHSGHDLRVPVFPADASVTQTLQNAAVYWGLPLVGDLDDPTTGLSREIHFSDTCVYAGCDLKVLDLLERVNHANVERRVTAIRALGELDWERETESYEALFALRLSRDEDERARAAAAIALEEAQTANSYDQLIAALGDSSSDVREHARATLSLIAGSTVQLKIKEALQKPANAEMREILMQILEERFGESLSEQKEISQSVGN